jgi:hypothetical protein
VNLPWSAIARQRRGGILSDTARFCQSEIRKNRSGGDKMRRVTGRVRSDIPTARIAFLFNETSYANPVISPRFPKMTGRGWRKNGL